MQLPLLSDTVPTQECSELWGSAQRLMRVSAFLSLLLSGFVVQRLLCLVGLPYDCLASPDAYEVFVDLTAIIMYGTALAWFSNISDCSMRVYWLLERWPAWLALYLGTPFVFSAISNVEVLKHSLVDFSTWGYEFVVLEGFGLTALLFVVVWHVVEARRASSGNTADFAAYMLPRLFVCVYFVGWSLVLERQPGITIHLHHLYIGWALAIWARFNKPLSACTLCIGCGIFVQGLAAYSFMPVFSEGNCFETPSAKAIDCEFWSRNGGAFTLKVCPAAGNQLPKYSCQ